MLTLTNGHEWLKARLHERGSSFARIARELGVTPSAVTHAAKGRHKSRKITVAIAAHAGIDPEEIQKHEGGEDQSQNP
ncbi:helix-turn-helix domain-containing protein [Paenirhodobacter populi]|uniref:helix-turn-helix domain-containing protein n=1 Tax=Paenirhodobacter populi TaxID=2306993 RepID=UPI0013E2BC0E|nr:helix-turn-helix domain-containing protein [Sinirhodobacter populi]